MKKKTLSLSLLLSFLLLSYAATCFAGDAPPKRIAILPTVNSSWMRAPEIEAYCNTALQENLRIPLNSILKVHEYVYEREILSAFPELSQPERLHKIQPSRLREVAKELNADLIVGFVITDMDEVQQHNWDGDLILYTHISMQLVGYDREKDAFINLKRREYYHDDFAPSGSLENITKKAVRYLLEKADFKKDIFPLSK